MIGARLGGPQSGTHILYFLRNVSSSPSGRQTKFLVVHFGFIRTKWAPGFVAVTNRRTGSLGGYCQYVRLTEMMRSLMTLETKFARYEFWHMIIEKRWGPAKPQLRADADNSIWLLELDTYLSTIHVNCLNLPHLIFELIRLSSTYL